MEGKEAFGALLVHRKLDGEGVKLRYSLSHTFPAPLFSLRLLLDGKLAREHHLSAPGQEVVEVHKPDFSEVGFAFAVDQRDVYPYRWGLQLDDIEIQGVDGDWHSICDLPATTTTVPVPEIVERPGDVIAAGSSGEDRAGGCDVGPASPTSGLLPPASGLPFLLLLLLLLPAFEATV